MPSGRAKSDFGKIRQGLGELTSGELSARKGADHLASMKGYGFGAIFGCDGLHAIYTFLRVRRRWSAPSDDAGGARNVRRSKAGGYVEVGAGVAPAVTQQA